MASTATASKQRSNDAVMERRVKAERLTKFVERLLRKLDKERWKEMGMGGEEEDWEWGGAVTKRGTGGRGRG